MKFRTLFLKAFGPFTNTTLDFTGPANLHVIFGTNEAGKSSALRAMADLRYGVHARSQDNFVHSFQSMLVAGSLEDAAGRVVGVARRKGNKDTLMLADPTTGEPLTGSQVPPDVLLALTGGVAREQFESMYGLDSDRLRKAGRQLVQGEGDLGATLFESSTGTANIRAMLATLQADARKYFAPRGQTMVLNEAARQLEEAKQRYKQALTKPEQWKTLNRAHEQSVASLAEVRARLVVQRQRHAELTELRAVEPLLRQLDQAAREWALVQHHVALGADARERRLAALQKQAQAQGTIAEADEVLLQCQRECEGLVIEPALITNAVAIERLASDMAVARRERETRVRLQASTQSEAEQLQLQAVRMLGAAESFESLEALFARTPSGAERATTERLLDESQGLTRELQQAESQLRSARTKLAQQQRDIPQPPAVDLRQALSLALTEAQALGDAQRRLEALSAAHSGEQLKLDRCIADLGLQSAEQLVVSRWLAPSDLDSHERAHGELVANTSLHADRAQKIQEDLTSQERRRNALAAVGEVVTADTLRQARGARDQGWRQIRAIFIDRHDGPGTGGSGAATGAGLPAAFEHVQTEADRQADLLREGAQRAAEVSECEQRIGEMKAALVELRDEQARDDASLKALEAGWSERLAALALPNLSAAAARDWLRLRTSGLDLHESLRASGRTVEELRQQIADATGRVSSALATVGRAPSSNARTLASVVAVAATADREITLQVHAAQRRLEGIQTLQQDIDDGEGTAAELTSRLAQCRNMIDEKCSALLLAAGASPEAVKARLAEFQLWVNDYGLHVEHLTQVRQALASDQSIADDARALARLLQEPMGAHMPAWVDGVVQRLASSRAATSTRLNVDQRMGQATRSRARAEAELASASRTLATLLEQSGLANVDDLPDAETRSDQRRLATSRLQELTEQLARTSMQEVDTLRSAVGHQDSAAIDTEKQTCNLEITRLETDEGAAIAAEYSARSALATVDTSGEAAQAREDMESAIARYRAGVRPWAQLKLAEALLTEALRRHRDKAQGPVVQLAGDYFKLITDGRFVRLLVDDEGSEPVLMAQPGTGKPISIGALSEGTGDQLHLALRLAALQVQRTPDRTMPLVLDDVLITSDDVRAACVFHALEKFSREAQVLVFTHHQHLVDIALRSVAPGGLKVHQLPSAFQGNP